MVYTVAFKFILRVQTENYAYFLLVGLLPWNFFSSSLIASTQAITGNANLIRKVYFPRETLPIATVLFAFSQLLLALAVFLPALLLVSGVRLHWTAILFIPLLLLHVLFTLGLAFILATCTVFFRDVAHLTEVAVVLLFWMTPIIYPVAMAPRELQLFFKLSPLAAFAIAYQDVLFWGRVPEEMVLSTLARVDRGRAARRPRPLPSIQPGLRRGSVGMASAVELRGVSKAFVLRHNPARNVKVRLIGVFHPRHREQLERFWALREIDLAVRKGECLGLIGPNGSGKSTLLRIMASIYRPTEGEVVVRGRVAPMIELGVGFQPDLTGQENVYLNTSLYGLSRRETDASTSRSSGSPSSGSSSTCRSRTTPRGCTRAWGSPSRCIWTRTFS